MVTVGKKTMPSIHMSCWILQSVATNNSLPFVVVQSVNMISFTFRSSASYIKRDCQHLNLIIPFVPNMRLTNHDKEETVRCAHLTKRDVGSFQMSYGLVALTSFSRSLSTRALTKECGRMHELLSFQS